MHTLQIVTLLCTLFSITVYCQVKIDCSDWILWFRLSCLTLSQICKLHFKAALTGTDMSIAWILTMQTKYFFVDLVWPMSKCLPYGSHHNIAGKPHNSYKKMNCAPTPTSYPEESSPGGTGSCQRIPSSEYCASGKTYCACTSHHPSSPSGLGKLDASR